MRRVTFVIVAYVFILAGFACAQSNTTDHLAITTYYPSPYGVYKNLKFLPSEEPTGVTQAGVMYYNDTEDVLKYYNNTTWVDFAGTECQLVDVDDNCAPFYDTSTDLKTRADSDKKLCCKAYSD